MTKNVVGGLLTRQSMTVGGDGEVGLLTRQSDDCGVDRVVPGPVAGDFDRREQVGLWAGVPVPDIKNGSSRTH